MNPINESFSHIQMTVSLDTLIGYTALVATVYFSITAAIREQKAAREARENEARASAKKADQEREERSGLAHREYVVNKEQHFLNVRARLDAMVEAAVNLAAERPAAYPNVTRVEHWHAQLKWLPDVGVRTTESPAPLAGYPADVHHLLKQVGQGNEAAFKKYREGRDGKLSEAERVVSPMWSLERAVLSHCMTAYDARHKS